MVELFVADIMSKVSDRRAQVLVLQEKDGLRKIIVALGFVETQAIVFAMRGYEPGRPLTHDLFGSLSGAFGIELQYALIDSINDGTFHAKLHYVMGDEVRDVDSRTSDAVAIALKAGVPVYIDDELLNRMCIRDEMNGAISIPITAADEDTLRTAMENAVKTENYELAMKLKEEIESRHTTAGMVKDNEEHEEQ